MTSHEIVSMLNAHGVRPTQQRIAVYRYLADHPVHPSADLLYRELTKEYPSFSRTTIYNSLHVLIKAGLARPLLIDADEQRFDGNPLDHGHFKCRRCGHIFDFELDESLLHSLCPEGFQAERRDICCTGLCASCLEKEDLCAGA
ncbi:MAG: transcriptional repressor [Clostridiales bacterium]|nr:transcriptional repressor [Clostridiales bacterium]